MVVVVRAGIRADKVTRHGTRAVFPPGGLPEIIREFSEVIYGEIHERKIRESDRKTTGNQRPADGTPGTAETTSAGIIADDS